MPFFTQIKCCKCNEQFQMTDDTYAVLKRSGQTFHCPWGHQQHFPAGKTELEKMTEERDAIIRQRDLAVQREARLRDERDAAERRVSAAKGQVTKLKKRAAGGVCPCCNRSFVALARHMKSKHPEFASEAIN